MNHCIIEPPLDRRGEGEEEAGRAQGWMGDGGREGCGEVGAGDERQRERDGEGCRRKTKQGGSQGERRWTRTPKRECVAFCLLCSANVTANLQNMSIKIICPLDKNCTEHLHLFFFFFLHLVMKWL